MNAFTKHELAVMNATGDTKTLWTPGNRVEEEVARAAFDKLKKEGFSIFHVDGEGNKARRMDEFDPKAGKLIAVPRIVGG